MARLNEESQRVRNIAASRRKVAKRYAFRSSDGLRLLECSKDDTGMISRLVTNESADAASPARLAEILGSLAHSVNRTNWRIVNAAMAT